MMLKKAYKKIIFGILACIIICSSSVLLTGCNKNSDSSKVLNVYNVGDYIDEDLITKFEEETGIQVQYSTYDTNEMMYQKIKSGSTHYDIVVPSDYMVSKMISEGLLEKIDFKNIPNIKHIDKKFLKPSYDKQNEYSVPYMWGTLGIVYNSKMVNKTVDSWDIFWDTDYKRNVLVFDSVRDTMGVALKKLGYSMNSINQNEINEARDILIEQKENTLAYVNDDGKDRMIGNEAAIGMFYSGDFPPMKEENPDLEYVIPKEGSNKWVDAMCIPTTAENKKEAELFINFLANPENAKQNTEYIGYSTPNKEAYKLLDDEIKNDKDQYPDEIILDKCETFINLGDEIKKYNKAWIQIKSN